MFYIIFGMCGFLIANFGIAYAYKLLDREYSYLSLGNLILSLISAIVFILIYYCCGMNYKTVIYFLTAALLISLSIVDWCSYEIPIQYNIIIFVLGLIITAFEYSFWYEHIIGMFLVSGILFLILLATKGQGMGGGDVKLMFSLGLLLGWKNILLVLFIGSLLGSIIHIAIMRFFDKNHMLAFGPYLSAAAIVVMMVGDRLVDIYTNYMFSANI